MPEYVSFPAREHRRKAFARLVIKNGFRPIDAIVEMGITTNRNSAHVIAYRLLRTATCEKYIQRHMEDSKASADEVLQNLTRIARTETKFSGSDVVKANELLGKGHKLFVDKIETTDTTDRDNIISAMSESIDRAAKVDNVSRFEAAIGLYPELPEHSDLSHWPEDVRQAITASLQKPEQISTIEGEQ